MIKTLIFTTHWRVQYSRGGQTGPPASLPTPPEPLQASCLGNIQNIEQASQCVPPRQCPRQTPDTEQQRAGSHTHRSEGFALTGYVVPGCVEDGAWMLWGLSARLWLLPKSNHKNAPPGAFL